MFYNASNNAWSRLSSAISASATSLTVQGGNWPEPPFLISIEDEIIEVNNKSGNTFSNLVRGMEGTTPAPHPANARVENRFTAGTYSLLKDVLTDSRIVEHNLTVSDPSNGWYIRWNNGLQVCWGSIMLDISDSKDETFYYPAEFADGKYSGRTWTGMSFWPGIDVNYRRALADIVVVSLGRNRFDVYKPTTSIVYAERHFWVAIGRWR